MSEILSLIESIGPYLKAFALAIALALGLIAAAAAVYTANTAFGPVLVVVRWMFAHSPGERPNDIVAGISFGGRMLAWALLVGVLIWVLFH